MKEKGRKGTDLGAENVQKFREYLGRTEILPTGRDGSVNVTALANAAGIPKQSIYKNPGVKALFERAREARGLNSWSERREEGLKPAPQVVEGASERDNGQPDGERPEAVSGQLRSAQRRIAMLEQHNAAMVAENHELRRQVRELHLELDRTNIMFETGRRVASPVKCS